MQALNIIIFVILFACLHAQANTKRAENKQRGYVAGPIRSTDNYNSSSFKKQKKVSPTTKTSSVSSSISNTRANTISSMANPVRTNSSSKKPKKISSKKTQASNLAPNSTPKQLRQWIVLSWPLEEPAFWISSPYGPRKNVDGSTGFHTGLDLAAVKGTPIKATNDGVVLEVALIEDPKDCKGYGNMVLLAHKAPNGTYFKTRYAHCDKVFVQRGQKVSKGETIASVGNTGNVRRSAGGDGSHLHLELYIGKKRVNPFRFLAKRTVKK